MSPDRLDDDPSPERTDAPNDQSLADALHRSVDEGLTRLQRPPAELFATGIVGGIDVSIGLFAFLVVLHRSGSRLLASLAFGIGFLPLVLARSELFTENFLVPVTAVVANRAPLRSLGRLWAGTAVFNLVGAFIVTALAMAAFPDLHGVARQTGAVPIDLGITWAAFADAILAGMVLTLMTWMERATESVPAKLIAAMATAFLLVAAPLQHAIVLSVEAFAALRAGAPFGYLDWLGAFAWAALGNAVGGIGLVTILRLVQVGPAALQVERDRPLDEEAP